MMMASHPFHVRRVPKTRPRAFTSDPCREVTTAVSGNGDARIGCQFAVPRQLLAVHDRMLAAMPDRKHYQTGGTDRAQQWHIICFLLMLAV
jgi:hypothetical protein